MKGIQAAPAEAKKEVYKPLSLCLGAAPISTLTTEPQKSTIQAKRLHLNRCKVRTPERESARPKDTHAVC